MKTKHNKNQQSKDVLDLYEESLQDLKYIPTKLHFKFIEHQEGNRVTESEMIFDTDEEVIEYAENFAIEVSGFSLDYWEHRRTDLCDYYELNDVELFGIVYRILIYPRKLENN